MAQALSVDGGLQAALASPHRFASWGATIWLSDFPKTPEAYALHYIDNLDARLEMILKGYPNRKIARAENF